MTNRRAFLQGLTLAAACTIIGGAIGQGRQPLRALNALEAGEIRLSTAWLTFQGKRVLRAAMSASGRHLSALVTGAGVIDGAEIVFRDGTSHNIYFSRSMPVLSGDSVNWEFAMAIS